MKLLGLTVNTYKSAVNKLAYEKETIANLFDRQGIAWLLSWGSFIELSLCKESCASGFDITSIFSLSTSPKRLV